MRRPAGVSSSGRLSAEQIRDETRYIRRDLLKLLLTTIVVVIFMVAAAYLVLGR